MANKNKLVKAKSSKHTKPETQVQPEIQPQAQQIQVQSKSPSESFTSTILKADDIKRFESETKAKSHYFNNALVEALLTKYVQGGCTDVKLRDEIMSHTLELLRQIIRTHNFHNIYGGRDPASFGDLMQVGYCQIEKCLYKFDWRPGHTKFFNMASQIAKTVILAHIKREMRDKKNYGTYKGHLSGRHRSDGDAFERFIKEATEMSKYDEDGQTIVDCLKKLYETDEKPYDGLIGKLVKLSGLSRQRVTSFLKQIRLRSFEFTDSPLNQERNQIYKGSRKEADADEEDESY